MQCGDLVFCLQSIVAKVEKNDSKTLRKFKKLGVNINGGKAGEQPCSGEIAAPDPALRTLLSTSRILEFESSLETHLLFFLRTSSFCSEEPRDLGQPGAEDQEELRAARGLRPHDLPVHQGRCPRPAGSSAGHRSFFALARRHLRRGVHPTAASGCRIQPKPQQSFVQAVPEFARPPFRMVPTVYLDTIFLPKNPYRLQALLTLTFADFDTAQSRALTDCS